MIPGVRANATTTKFADGCITRTSEGKSYRTSRFGSGTISRDSKGATTTTQRFWDGPISRRSSGTLSHHRALWERLYDLAEQWARRGVGVLVVPGLVRGCNGPR